MQWDRNGLVVTSPVCNIHQLIKESKIIGENIELTGFIARTGIIQHSLNNAAKGRFVRFYPIAIYKYWPCLAVEIFVLA